MNWLERSWYKQGYWSYLLLPLTLLFFIISTLRKLAYRTGLKQQNRFTAPVIIVGNISVGGTGKTPFVIYLVALLKQQGFKPGIVSRGYGAKEDKANPFPRVVNKDTNVELAGDEPKLLALRTGVPVVIAPNRSEAVNTLIKQMDCDIVISDDGLQHYAMARDIEIVLLDKQRGLGNGWLLPVGPLRESAARLKTVDLVIENAGFDNEEEQAYSLKPSQPYQLLNKDKLLADKVKVKLISGIGNPQRFLDTVEGFGLEVEETVWLPDHHKFTAKDFESFGSDDVVLMTEKDAVKCTDLVDEQTCQNWYVLPIEACITESVEQQLINKLQRLK